MTAGIATNNPTAVVTRASEIPPATAARPVAFSLAIPLKAFRMPTTVPNRPTKGAVEPIVARPPSPRFSSACTIASVRSRARFEASMVSPGISPGESWWALNSIRPAVTTLARWLFLLRSATLMASSILPSRSAPATAGANERDWLRAALNAIQRSIITPIDQPDMIKRITTTIFARRPICFQSEIGSQLGWLSCKSQAARICRLLNATAARLTTMSCFPSSKLCLTRPTQPGRIPFHRCGAIRPEANHRNLRTDPCPVRSQVRSHCCICCIQKKSRWGLALGRRKHPFPASGQYKDGEDLNRHKSKPSQSQAATAVTGCSAGLRIGNRLLAAVQAEIDNYLGLNRYRLSIEQVRLVAPLFHGLDCGRGQHGMPADQLQILNRTFFADLRLEHDLPLDARLPRQRRIIGLHSLDQQALRYTQRNAHARRSRNFGNGY